MAFPQLGGALIELCEQTVLPLLAVTVIAAFLANVAMNRGFLFSLAPMTPNFDHINPFTGLTRIFALKNWVELAKTIVKGVLLGSALFFVVAGTLNTLIRLPACGEELYRIRVRQHGATAARDRHCLFPRRRTARHSAAALAVPARHADDDQRGQARASGSGGQSANPAHPPPPPRGGRDRARDRAAARDAVHRRGPTS